MKTYPEVATARETKRTASANILEPAKILVITDFSPLSRSALHAAAAVAAIWPGVTVSLVHVVPPPHPGSGCPCEAWRFEDLSYRVGKAERQLRALKTRYRDDVPFVTRALVGHPGHTICDLCQTGEFDLVILSSHGATGVAKMVLGSVARTIISDARVSVLVIKPRVNKQGQLLPIDLQLHRVLVGCDHRSGGKRAFEVAREIGGRCNARLTLMQALPPLASPDAPSEADVAEAAAGLRRLCSLHMPEAKDWEVRAAIGEPWEVLVEAAKDSGSDLIVLGPHEHTRWGHAFVGSTAEQVVALAPCAVLALK